MRWIVSLRLTPSPHLDREHAFAISSPAPDPTIPTPRMRSVCGSIHGGQAIDAVDSVLGPTRPREAGVDPRLFSACVSVRPAAISDQ
jgi:hypothetical protein